MGSDKDLVSNKLAVILIGMGSAGLLVSIYHCISVALCRYRSTTNRRPHVAGGGGVIISDNLRSTEEISTIQLIPTRIYTKGDGVEEEGEEDATCSICLCEFQKGEQVRCLPECGHYFHVPCIDMWLYTHLSCPICRADATPPPSILSAEASTRHPTTMDHVVQILQ